MPTIAHALRVSAVFAVLVSTGAAAAAYEGFGATTRGGAGGSLVHVTTRADSGPGSFRDALAGGHRTIVFDVAGEIVLRSEVSVRGPFVTIDGFTAFEPGITLRNFGLDIRGSRGAHDVIVRGIRVRDAWDDGIRVAYGAYNVVIDHVSVHGSADGNIDITEDARDVTVSWSVLAEPKSCGHNATAACRTGREVSNEPTAKNMLICYNASRVTLHHNLFVSAAQRNPMACTNSPMAGTTLAVDPDTTLDMRNNLVWDWWKGFGTSVSFGPRANIVGNFYASPHSSAYKQTLAIVVNGEPGSIAWAHVAANVSGDRPSTDVNSVGNASRPFAAPAVATTDACRAAADVLSGAGVRPLDPIDAWFVGFVTAGGWPCGKEKPPVDTPPAPDPRPAPAPAPDAPPSSWTAPRGCTTPAPLPVGRLVVNCLTGQYLAPWIDGNSLDVGWNRLSHPDRITPPPPGTELPDGVWVK